MEALRKSPGPSAISSSGSPRDPDVAAARLHPEIFSEPIAARRPQSLLKMPDEILDFYAFMFCQRGFRNLGMTFEQFLEVIEAIRPEGLRGSRFAQD